MLYTTPNDIWQLHIIDCFVQAGGHNTGLSKCAVPDLIQARVWQSCVHIQFAKGMVKLFLSLGITVSVHDLMSDQGHAMGLAAFSKSTST